MSQTDAYLAPSASDARAQKTTPCVAFYCAEYAIDDRLPSFAGGLGILAGDLLLEAADQGLNFNLISLFYHSAFADGDGQNIQSLRPENFGFSVSGTISCPLADRRVATQIWTKKIGSAGIFLLDTNLPQNSPRDQNITKLLYGPDDLTMLEQQIILGFGSVELFRLLNMKPDIYHLNEGHTALAILALAVSYAQKNPGTDLKTALEAVKPEIVATKHTILPSAGLHIPWELPRIYLGPIIESAGLSFPDLLPLAAHKSRPEMFSTTQLLLSFSQKSSAVSFPHAKFEKDIHPESPLIPITNGVNRKRWQPAGKSKAENKQDLAGFLSQNFSVQINTSALLIVWARRLAAYKRPHLLFSDLTRLEQLVNLPNRPVQIIIAGRVYSSDPETTGVAKEIENHCQGPNLKGHVIFLPEYNLPLAKKLSAAADIWLNTPLPGKEASGTSGMKAGLNGALQFSTADGWIAENDWTNMGWILFEDDISKNLYDTIEKEIVPLYFDQPEKWQQRAAQTRNLVEKNYLTSRVLKDYLAKLYPPSS